MKVVIDKRIDLGEMEGRRGQGKKRGEWRNKNGEKDVKKNEVK